MKISDALEELKTKKPQTKLEITRGVHLRLKESGIPVLSVHYSADPDRDPEINPNWKKLARKDYSSQGEWDREQEIVDEAGGGELVFAETLRTYWDRIVITDPKWRPDPDWKVGGGFDHGKTNPTALERSYVDFQGNIYFCGEYYVPGKNVWQHAPELLKMPDVDRMECMADPTVFDQKTQQQDKEEAKAIAELYEEHGVKFLSRFNGNRNDLTFVERVMAHWANLEEREPTLFIVCRNASDKPQPGLHPWDCPNLLWEMLRCRKKKLTAQQLQSQNPSEQILDKDNHAIDSAKYWVMTQPEPGKVPRDRRLREAASKYDELDVTNRIIAMKREEAQIYKENHPPAFGGNVRQRLQQLQRRGR